jgi:hypothetical protein
MKMPVYPPRTVEDLKNPAFIKWLKVCGENTLSPDLRDYGPGARTAGPVEWPDEYYLARATKFMRLYRQWEAEQN